MFRTFDHTADLGIEGEAESLERLFAEMARGLFAVLLADLDAVRLVDRETIELPGDPQPELLLLDWLDELLYRFEVHRRVYAAFEVHLDDSGLRGIARGEPLDPRRHSLQHEVKAITYHELRVWEEGGRWRARVIVDI